MHTQLLALNPAIHHHSSRICWSLCASRSSPSSFQESHMFVCVCCWFCTKINSFDVGASLEAQFNKARLNQNLNLTFNISNISSSGIQLSVARLVCAILHLLNNTRENEWADKEKKRKKKKKKKLALSANDLQIFGQQVDSSKAKRDQLLKLWKQANGSWPYEWIWTGFVLQTRTSKWYKQADEVRQIHLQITIINTLEIILMPLNYLAS